MYLSTYSKCKHKQNKGTATIASAIHYESKPDPELTGTTNQQVQNNEELTLEHTMQTL